MAVLAQLSVRFLRPVSCGPFNGELRRAPFGNVGGDGRDGAFVGCAAQRFGRDGELFAEQLDLSRRRVERVRVGVASPIGQRHERLGAIGAPSKPFLEQPVERRQPGATLAVALGTEGESIRLLYALR